jgi:hypothetical protein
MPGIRHPSIYILYHTLTAGAFGSIWHSWDKSALARE